MDQIPHERIIQLVRIHHLPVQQPALVPPRLPAPLLVDQQPAPQRLRVCLQEARQLLQVHGRVELQVGFDERGEDVGADLVHEDAEVVVHGVGVQRGRIEVRRRGGDEFRAGGAEEFLEEREALGAALLEPRELVAVFFAEGGVDGVVELGGAEGDADGDEGVHLVVFLGDGIVAGGFFFLEVLRARDVHQDVAEHADGVGVAAHHHVAEADVVVCREVRGHDAREHGFLVQLDVVERFEREAEISEQAVYS